MRELRKSGGGGAQFPSPSQTGQSLMLPWPRVQETRAGTAEALRFLSDSLDALGHVCTMNVSQLGSWVPCCNSACFPCNWEKGVAAALRVSGGRPVYGQPALPQRLSFHTFPGRGDGGEGQDPFGPGAVYLPLLPPPSCSVRILGGWAKANLLGQREMGSPPTLASSQGEEKNNAA